MCFPLKEEREEGEGESISPLGAEQEALRECFGLRWAKEIALALSVDKGRMQYVSCVPIS